MHIKQLEQKSFEGYLDNLIPLKNLLQLHTDSYQEFLNIKLRETFEEVFPVYDSKNRFVIELVDCSLKTPNLTEEETFFYLLSYAAPFYIKLRLINNATKVKKEQEILFAEIPILTKNKTFIINGIEKTIISQIVRASGLRFYSNFDKKGNKLFNAEVRPIKGRGFWIFFESTVDEIIYVKLDRGTKKVPVSTFIRLFGVEDKKKVLNLFKDNKNAFKIMEKNFEIDVNEDMDSVWQAVYKVMKGSEAINAEKAREFIQFRLSKEYFDLSEHGRAILNKKSGRSTTKKALENRSLNLEDIVFIVKEIDRLNNTPNAPEDDIDDLAFRKVRSVGELITEQVRIGLLRIKRNLIARMSTKSHTVLENPVEITNLNIFKKVISNFFLSNELAQKLDQANLLDELEHLRTVSASGPGGVRKERSGTGIRDIHPSHYGKLCPIHTPSGGNVGIVLKFALYSRVTTYGLIEVPYMKVKNGLITDELVYLTADEETKYNIAPLVVYRDKKPLKDRITVRNESRFKLVDKKDVNFVDVSSGSGYSLATCLIPFALHNTSIRTLYGSKMLLQAVPLLNPEAPLISTGYEAKIANITNKLIVAEENGVVTWLDSQKLTLKGKKRTYEYNLTKFFKSKREKGFNDFQTSCVSLGQKVKKGDVLADVASTKNGQLALGKNLRVGFLSYKGLGFEDAIAISSRLISDDVLTSIEAVDQSINVRETKLGEEIVTSDIPSVAEHRLKHLAPDGIVAVGSYVKTGDVLVGKLTPRGESQLTPEEKLLQSIFGDNAEEMKNTSCVVPPSKGGRVVSVDVRDKDEGFALDSGVIKQIRIVIAELRHVREGDKLANRHGNKGVISKVLPVEDMPFTKDGEPLDVILTPLGVPSRQNPGQILETHLGLAAHKLGYQVVVPPMTSITDKELYGELKKAGYDKSGKVTLYHGETGEKLAQDVTIGYMYITKLTHMVEDKIHARSTGTYSIIQRQPLGGRDRDGGQRLGEMEVWALLGHSAAYTLREMLTIKSDDEKGRNYAMSAIIKGDPITYTGIPSTFHVLLYYLRSLGLNMEFINDIDFDTLNK